VRLPQLPPEEAEKVVLWEAEERLPYPAQEAEIRHLMAGEVRQDANIKQEVILMACHRGALKRHLGVLEQAGLVPEAIDVEPCAILRGFCRGLPEHSSRLAYLHLGEQSTAVIFAEGEQILFLKYVNRGGKHLDQAVAQHLSLPLKEAAAMRTSVMDSAQLEADNEVHRSVIEAIRGTLEALSTEIELCLRYFKVTFRGKPLERIVVSGSEASPWLAEFLSESLRTPCELGNPFQALARWPAVSSALGRPARWATAIGLSLK
jgi:type IV pilus assembly protein PilM